MDIKLKMESSDSAKEPSRRSPFVRGLSGQNYSFSSGYSPFVGGAPGDRRWTPTYMFRIKTAHISERALALDTCVRSVMPG